MTTTAPVVTIGETMALIRTVDIGSLATASEARIGVGGAESNVAIALRRLGTPAAWIGRVGADSLGRRVVRELRGEDVQVVAVVDRLAPTGLMLKERTTSESSAVFYYRAGSAGAGLVPGDLDAELIGSASMLHVTGITLALSESADATIRTAIDLATAAGVPVSFDVNHRPSLWRGREDAAADAYRGIAARADIVFAGDAEAALLTGVDAAPEDLARAITDLGPAQVVVKLGADGCAALIDGSAHRVPAIPIRPLDTVGAGDAFVAGYLAELLAGLPAEQRLRTAVRTGAFACLGSGDWESYPRRDELGLLDAQDPVAR